jgi:hypothetical protein
VKKKQTRHSPELWRTFESVEFATLRWVDSYDIGYLNAPRAEAEEMFCEDQGEQARNGRRQLPSLWKGRGGSQLIKKLS